MNAAKYWMVVGGVVVLLASETAAAPPGFVKSTIPLGAPPVGVAFAADGRLFALEGAAFGDSEATLKVIDPDGSFSANFAVMGDDISNFFVGGMAYDPIGDRVLITDNTSDGRLYAVDAAGVKQTIGMGIAGIAGVAVRSTGQIFVSTAPFGSPGEVLQVDRTTGVTTPVLGGLGYGAGMAFDPGGNLIVQDASTATFLGRLQRLPMTDSAGVLTLETPEPLLDGMQSSAGLSVTSDGTIFTTGNGGLFRVSGTPLAETSFDANGSAFQFATAIAFDPGSQPFDGFSGPDGGRLAYMADFGFASQDSFVTLLTPAEPGDYNGDGHVTATDYAVWRAAYGTSDPSADGSRDGTVDATDYVLWRKHLPTAGQNTSVAVGTSVPEPVAISPAIFVILSIALRANRNFGIRHG